VIKRILNQPALIISGREDVLIVADLHLGMFNYDDFVLENLMELARRVDRIFLLGDVKHRIGMWGKEVKQVERLIITLEKAGISKEDIIIVKGNHDGGIDSAIGVDVKSSRGIVYKKIGLFHGHATPSDDVLRAKTIIFAHAHPAVFIKDKVGGVKKRVWLEGAIEIDGKVKEVIVLPAFNDICASTSVNLERPVGVFFKNGKWDYKKAEAVLLDGTLLGDVASLV